MKKRNCWRSEAASPGQMELRLGGDPNRASRPCRKTQRLTRARWWFSRMRQVVGDACDQEPAERPVQDTLPGTEPRGYGKD